MRTALADSPPQPRLTLGFAEIAAGAREVLTVAEIAEATGVKERQVHHWSSGDHAPKGEARDRLLTLHQTITRLRLALGPEQIKVWLLSPLADSAARPIDLIAEGSGKVVLASAADAIRREELDDVYLVELARRGNTEAYDWLVRRYRGLVREEVKATNDSEGDDLIQEGLLGLYKAIRDYRPDQGHFKPYAENSIAEQIQLAVGGRRFAAPDQDRVVPMSARDTAELDRVMATISEVAAQLGDFESRALSLYLDGFTIAGVAERLDVKTGEIEEAMTRVKRKVGAHLAAKTLNSG
jgi:RNA polymerase sporulation-specific sigma factor